MAGQCEGPENQLVPLAENRLGDDTRDEGSPKLRGAICDRCVRPGRAGETDQRGSQVSESAWGQGIEQFRSTEESAFAIPFCQPTRSTLSPLIKEVW